MTPMPDGSSRTFKDPPGDAGRAVPGSSPTASRIGASAGAPAHRRVPPARYADAYLRHVCSLLAEIPRDVAAAIIARFEIAGEAGNTIYCIGNGGSAAIASHFANDLSNGTRAPGRKNLKAISLADNTSTLTTLGNDEGFEHIFVRQLEPLLERGDVLVAISCSGRSPNVVSAVHFAKSVGATTISLTSFDGGPLSVEADLVLRVPARPGEYGPAEDGFGVVAHLIYSYLRSSRRGEFDAFVKTPNARKAG